MRGEKKTSFTGQEVLNGTTPHTRGKEAGGVCYDYGLGTTPHTRGKRDLVGDVAPDTGKTPHARGKGVAIGMG